MNTILKISWRNVWRNRKRSLVMVIAIMVGLWGGIFAAALAFGLIEQRFQTAIEQHISHVQIHHPEFLKESNIRYGIEAWEDLNRQLLSDPDIQAHSGRILVNGMLASANLSQGVNIIGVDPDMEQQTTRLDQNVKGGSYFGMEAGNQILIGQSLAEKTRLQERSRVVLTFQSIDSELVSATFRVAGIFQTANSVLDETNVYVLQSDLLGHLGDGTGINEVAILCVTPDAVEEVTGRYRASFPGLSVRTWAEVSPELSYLQEMGGTMMVIILVIILLALAFGLVNTMLMSVYERIRELGMLMAVGMNKKRIFSMIILETSFLTLLGAGLGVLLSLASIRLLGERGLDLSVVGGDSMNDLGFASVVYLQLEPSFFMTLFFLVVATALLTSVFPAMKALRLRPAEAVRHE
jgi:ABC-type lipoprotein release transport system permease subunit